jgi:hypothetical protein
LNNSLKLCRFYSKKYAKRINRPKAGHHRLKNSAAFGESLSIPIIIGIDSLKLSPAKFAFSLFKENNYSNSLNKLTIKKMK